MAIEKTIWGTKLGTGSASVDYVLINAKRPLTDAEIIEEIRRLNKPLRKKAGPHLTTLKDRGFIENTSEGWIKRK
jgi:hypothetical protein